MRWNNFLTNLFFILNIFHTRKNEFRKYSTSLFTWWGQGFKRLNRILLWRLMLLKGRWKVRTSLLAFSCPAKHNGAKSFIKEPSYFCALTFSRDDFWKIYVLFISTKIKRISWVGPIAWKYECYFRNYLTSLCLPHSIARIYRKSLTPDIGRSFRWCSSIGTFIDRVVWFSYDFKHFF
jgi:hypothetical protein